MERIINKELDEILGKKYHILDNGFITVVDYMGGDQSVVNAARISYGSGTKRVSEDRHLIRYLMRHQHCYHPYMEVLTMDGWKCWQSCKEFENYVVPDPKTKTLKIEKLKTEVFDVKNEEMFGFKNQRLSYLVNRGHRMWFKPKNEEEHSVFKVEDMPHWGSFELPVSYKLPYSDTSSKNYEYEFIGFYLGDGSFRSTNTIRFHLKKERKILFLETLLERLGLDYKKIPSKSRPGAFVYSIATPNFLKENTVIEATADKKEFTGDLNNLTSSELLSLFNGLINSDGSLKKDRKAQIQFSSMSENLVCLFETLANTCGYPSKRRNSYHSGRLKRSTAYSKETRTTLESRKQYHYKVKNYTGKVYCTTSSTGLLLVRGNSHSLPFICGNTTPFEMPEITFHVRVPMDAWRQWVRHRTASINEYSTRYSLAIDEKQTTLPGEWRFQSTDNKQGSEGFLPIELGEELTKREKKLHDIIHDEYEFRIKNGVAREQARKDLSLSTYTEAFWKVDLRNLLHFLHLRMDSHAQKEIRDYATTIGYEIVAKWCPVVWEAYVDYVLESVRLTKHEVNVLRALLSSGTKPGNWDDARLYLEQNKLLNYDENQNKKKNRELEELNAKLIHIGLPERLSF
jgi:thymidylate synthase (FAD)